MGWPWRSGRDPAWLPFFTPSSPLGSALCKMQMGIHSRPVREGACLGTCKIGLLHIYEGWHGLRVLIDSCKLHNKGSNSACLSHHSICYNQMYVCIEYLWNLNGLLAGCLKLLEDTAVHQGHMCLSWRSPCGWFLSTVHSFRARVQELEKSCGYFCSISVSSPGLVWGEV